MKKIIAFLLCLGLMLSMAGCLAIPVPDSISTVHTEPSATEESALQEGYCWVYGTGAELAAFAQMVADAENLQSYYVHDFDGDGLGELILQQAASTPVVYRFMSGAILKYTPAEDLNAVLSGLTPFSGNDNFTGLASIYSEQTKTQIPVTELFTKVRENLFTNGRETFAGLSDGTVLLIDTATPSVKIYTQLQSYDHILGVTKKSVYISHINTEIDIGSDIYSLDRNGYRAKDLGIVLTGSFIPGVVLIQDKRTDVSPAITSIYNNNDEVLLEDICSWGHTIHDGALYCTQMDEDLYEQYGSTAKMPFKLLRIDENGVTVILELSVPIGHCATLYDGKLMVMDYSDMSSKYYDLSTGQLTVE